MCVETFVNELEKARYRSGIRVPNCKILAPRVGGNEVGYSKMDTEGPKKERKREKLEWRMRAMYGRGVQGLFEMAAVEWKVSESQRGGEEQVIQEEAKRRRRGQRE